jgi:hypothetical protein
MPRTLGPGFAAAIAAEQGEFVHLLEITFSGGPIRLTTGTQQITWNAVNWQAVGGLLEFGGVEETADQRAQGVELRLSGVDQTIIAALLSSNQRGRTVRIWRAALDPVLGTVKDSPLLLFEGLQLEGYAVQEDRDHKGGTVSIRTRVVGYLALERVRGIVANLVSHQHHFAGDLFFQHTASLGRRMIYWGTRAPATVQPPVRPGDRPGR